MSAVVPSRKRLRVAVLGVSTTPTCGVRDHAGLLSAALAAEDVECSQHWLSRADRSLSEARAEFSSWTRALAADLRAERPDAALLHYSVFSYAHRGVPLFVRATLAAIGSAHVPLVSFLHEFAYPWGRSGVRGGVWAVSQRAALIDVVRSSAAVVVTTRRAEHQLASARWLPRRTIGFAPVFSNLPVPSDAASSAPRDGHTVGLFGYGYEGAGVDLVLDAVGELHRRDPALRLQLLGAPGPGSGAAHEWSERARARGIEGVLGFSGVLPPQELADALARCDVLLHPEPSGPTSRKGTLVGSLAAGRPVVALDGRRAWRELTDQRAVLLAAPRAGELADVVAGLLGDPARAEEQGARGGEFARQEMGVERTAREVRKVLDSLALTSR
jgi:glycosyltransferase involved in cell wall biosynthesis